MSKLILKVNRHLPYNELLRLEETIKEDLEKNGFAIIDNSIDIYEIKTEKDDK